MTPFEINPFANEPPSEGEAMLAQIEQALEQAQDCIRGETPEDISDAEAREDTISKVREAMRNVAVLRAAARPGMREALGIVRSAYYADASGRQEEAWNSACEHIEEGITALAQQEDKTNSDGRNNDLRHFMEKLATAWDEWNDWPERKDHQMTSIRISFKELMALRALFPSTASDGRNASNPLDPLRVLARIVQIIENVDLRAMACDGPVTPTLQEMTQAEISEIYAISRATLAVSSTVRVTGLTPDPNSASGYKLTSQESKP